MRGNLMGKRVDFSARTVITGDPNLVRRRRSPLTFPVCCGSLALASLGPEARSSCEALSRA